MSVIISILIALFLGCVGVNMILYGIKKGKKWSVYNGIGLVFLNGVVIGLHMATLLTWFFKEYYL